MLTEKIKISRFNFFNVPSTAFSLLFLFAGLIVAQSTDSKPPTPPGQNLPARAETRQEAIDTLSNTRSFRARINVTSSREESGKFLLEFAAPDRIRLSVLESKGGDSDIFGLYEAIEVGGKTYTKVKSDSTWEVSDTSIIKKSVEMRNEISKEALSTGVSENISDIKESQDGDFTVYEATSEASKEKHGLTVKLWVDRNSNLPRRLELVETGYIDEELFWVKIEMDFYDYDAVIEILPPM